MFGIRCGCKALKSPSTVFLQHFKTLLGLRMSECIKIKVVSVSEKNCPRAIRPWLVPTYLIPLYGNKLKANPKLTWEKSCSPYKRNGTYIDLFVFNCSRPPFFVRARACVVSDWPGWLNASPVSLLLLLQWNICG